MLRRESKPWKSTALLGCLLLTSCPPTKAASTTFGRVSGLLQVSSIGPAVPIPGSVTLISENGQQYTVQVAKDGKFSFRVPSGTYTAGGGSPQVRAANATNAEARCYGLGFVHVHTGATVQIVVTCNGFQLVGPHV